MDLTGHDFSDFRLNEALPLETSGLWPLQKAYYQNRGLEAWRETPYLITGSVSVAELYADLLVAWLKDLLPQLDLSQPVTVLEWGAGSGRLGFHLIRETLRKKNYFQALDGVDLQFILTDLADKNVDFWNEHPAFQPYLRKGLLAFGRFDPLQDTTFILKAADKTWPVERFVNPVLVIANYFFDSIPQAAFQWSEQTLKQGLIRLESCEAGLSPQSLGFDTVRAIYEYRDLPSAPDLSDDGMNAILQEYVDRYRDAPNGATFPFPVGPLRAIRTMQALCPAGLGLLSSDKAFTDPDFMHGLWDYRYATHGSISFVVNFDAICRDFERQGGWAMRTTDLNLALQTLLCIGPGMLANQSSWQNLAYVFQERLIRRNWMNAGPELLKAFPEYTLTPQDRLTALLAYIRTSLCDPAAFCACAFLLDTSLGEISDMQRLALVKLMDQAWQQYYPFDAEPDLPLWLGRLLARFGINDKSLQFLQLSLESGRGPADEIYFRMGCCWEALNDPSAAQECFTQALQANPNYTVAREKLAKTL